MTRSSFRVLLDGPGEAAWNMSVDEALLLEAGSSGPVLRLYTWRAPALSLGYRSGVPWNETHFSSQAFDRALDEAETTLDPTERKVKMERVQKILQDAAVMWQPVFRPVYMLVSKSVHGLVAHPTQFHQLQRVWVG